MRMLASATSLMLVATALLTTVSAHPKTGLSPTVRDPVVKCGNADYVIVLNLQRKDFDSLTAYQQQMTAVVARARLLTENDIGVGFVAFSKKVEHTIPVTRNLTLVQRKLNRLLSQLPRFDGIATGDAMLAAKHLLAKYHHQLVEVGRRKCKLLAVVAVGGDRNAGTHRTFAASTQLRRVASHVFAVNLAGGASPKELYRIASDGTRGIFDASNIVEVLTKTEAYAQVFCPCPLSWTTYDNCTVRGRAQVQRFFYNRSEELPHNCIRKLAISFEPCDCPPNRVERSECVNGFIRISTFVYSRPDNNSDCTESVTTQTEACGRATGCESFVCPPGSVCVNGTNNTIRCNCTNPNDIFKTTGCESCGDRSPLTRYGPCINRQRTVVVTTFTRINDTYCHHVFNMRKENCSACQGSGSRQFGPCVRGYQQVTVTLYRLRGGRCYKSLKTFQRPCRLQSEYQCIGSALSGGQFLTYDGQLIDFPGPCEYLLSERQGHFQVRVRHAIKFPSLPQLTQLDAIVIVMGNRSYELANNLVFKVGAVAQPLPYSDAASGIEAIYSDDALVFAAGDLYVQMRGSAATINVRSGAGGLRGILGNCNGSPGDDFTNSSGQDVSQQSNPSAALGNSFRLTTCSTADCCSLPDTAPACGTNASMEAASVSNCGHLTADAMSPFAHCGQTAMQPLFRACISLYCRAKANTMWQRSLVCSTLEAAAFRCYLQQQNGTQRSRYPIFRSSNFCPKSCGHNAEFVDDADFCPRTCARHFFNSQSLGCVTPFGFRSRNVNGQSPLPGCQCKPGFVLDGSNCVLPNECECISNLCIDRQNRTVCEAWKAQGYCDKYPLQMRRYCKLTCDQCQAPCQDQISKTTCQTIKSQGRCGDSFYKQMCQLTCNPSDCECPPCKTVRGPCDSQNKNRRVVTYCYAPDSNGRCQRSQSSSVYEPCGDCQEQQQRVDTRSCNYCTQEQVTRIVRTVRETTGEMRCIEVNTNMTTRSPGCECQTNTNRTVCYRNSELYVINTVSAPSADCATCNTTVTETRLRNVTCTKVVKRGECDQVVTKRRPVTVTRGIVRNCQCDLITEQYEEMCVCPKPHWTPTICHRNRAKLRWFVAFSLVHGRCVPIVKPHKHRVPCPRRHHVKYKCKSCNRYKLHSWYERRHCRCIRKKKTVEAGRCCCPKPKKVRGECIGQHRRILITHYTLDNYECQADTREISERCGCPPSRPIKECDGETGVITVGKLVFKLVDGTCEEVRLVKTEPTVCKKMRVIRRGPCRLLKADDVVKYRRVYYELWKRIHGDCKCKHIKRSKLVACGCREPQVRVSKCPSGCPTTSRSCPEHCYRTRAVVEYRLEDGKCHPEERDQQDLPCCCEKPRNKPPVCENGKILAIRKYHVQLVANACKIKKHVVRKDVTRHCDLTDVRRMRHGDVVIVKRRVVRNCRCIWRERRTSCPARCPPPSKFVRCDGATGERVLIKQFYKMNSCHCLPVKRIRRLPVDCPEPRIERRNFCFRENPAVIIRRINFYVDGECHCRKKVSEKRYQCEGEVCDQRPSVRLHCHANRLYNVVTLFKRDEEGRCAPHEFKHRVETPPCTGHGKRKKVKKCVNGKLILLINWLERRHCKCHTRYRKSVIGSCNSYCEHRNRGKSLRTRRRCNKHTNELVVYRLKWNFDGDHCVRRWVATNKRVEPDCPGPRLRRLPCDHETGKQRLEKLVYHMRNCKCRGPKVKVSYRKCTCRGPKVLGRYCDHQHGCIVVRMLIHKWNFEMDACHTRLVRKSIPVPCKHHIHSSHGACIHGHMQYRRTRYVRDRHNCRCRKKIEKKLVNCHCPVVIRRKKCNDRRSVAVTRIVYRKFSTKKRRCVTVKVKRHHRKCRCPKPKEVKKCVNGKRLVKRFSYRLVEGECERDKSSETFSIVCRKPPVVRSTKCDENTCFRKILTYKWKVNPKNCRCQLQLVHQKTCRCCGCPKHKLSRTCIKGKIWKFTVVIHSLRIKKCSKTCRRHVTHRTERVRCPQKKRVHWSRCHRCRSRKMVTKFRSIGCRCRRRLYKTDHFRSCCCHGGTRVKKLCQQSTGLWVRHISKKKLSGHKCVRHTKVKYLPRPVCRLPETPVTYGVCNRTTCQQTVTKVVNVLNKHTCSCHMVSKPAGTRTCCCLNTTPEIKINCVNNNMKQRVTVAPVFDEATHTCTTKTEIATELVTCGDGETRSSDPPCTGETRTIVRTRSVVVNCVCVNQTVDTRTEMCTCPSPTKWTVRCDVNSGKQVLTRTVYNLVNGSCSAVTETKLRTVFCNQKPQVVPVCNRDSCIETVTTTVTRLDMSTCTCVPDRTISTRQCCCPTTTQTRNECIDNQINTITTRQTLNAVTRTCESSDTTTRSGEVPCKNETRVNGPCDRATRKRKIKVTRREIINCQCQTTGVSVVRELCACPPTRKNQGQCDRKTCMRQVTLVKFNAVTSNNGTLHCVKTISHRQQRCCCTPLGHKRVRVHVQCDRETGNILINKEWSKFVASTKQCRTLHKSWIKEVDCTRKFDGEGHLEHRGRCNHRTGRRKIIMKWYTHDTRKCRCKLHVRKHYRICSCKHKRGMKHKYCDKETNELVSVRKFFVLEDDQCIPQESQKRKQIVCATNRQVKESCNNCDNVKVISYYVLSNCKCRKKEIVEKTKCCCPEEKFYRKCHLGKIKITTVKFRLSEDKRSCERIENHKYRRVRCSRKHKLKRGKCNHETCWAKDKLFKFYARKCHCHKQVHVKKRRCCCPKPKLRTRCRGRGILIHEKTVYHLHDGHCEPQLSRKRVRVHCPEPKHLGKSHCSRRTGRRSIQFKVFKLHKCRCVPKLQRRFEICACPRPRVVRQHCKDGRHHRAVFKIYFHRYEGSCKAKKRFIYKEPCHCPQPSHKTFCDPMDGHTLVKQTESFQMTMRHGRRECIHSHHEKPHRVHCHKRSVHRGRCYDGQRKISIIEYKVRHCRCIKKQHVRYIRCRRRLHHRRQRRCHYGRIIKIASVYDPDSGEMREQRHVKRILCRERPRVVPLSRGCKLREEDGGFYRKVAVIKSVLSGCHCKQKRRISWRLCRCHGSKTLHRCIHDFIEHQYTEKHHRHNGHCRRRRERRTREHRCSKRPVAIRKSRCDHHSCKRRVFLRRCYLKHCSCRCKQRVGYENCCTPPPVKKRYCKDGRWHYINTRFRMHKDRLIGKDSDSGDEWRKMEVNPHTKRWSKRVDCPEPEIRQTCNRDTGILTKRITIYRNIHCKCRPRMRTVHSRCQCPPPKTRAGNCVRGRRRLRHTKYLLGKNGHCHRHHTVSWKPCGCPKPRKKYRCHRGQIQICTTVFRKHRACRPKRQCRSKKVHCPPPKTKRGNCSQKTKKFKISHIRYTVNQKTCKCDRHVVARFAFCTCHHLKRKQKKCHGNVWVTVKINYRLNQGECVPDESVSHKAVKCRRQLTELVPGSCERRKGLSSSGTQIARTLTSVPVKCHCKNRVRTHRVPCICHLIKKYKTQKTTVCHSDRWLVTKVLQYRLVKGKCKPRKHKKSKTIRCHGRKIKQTACFKDDLGDSFQYELTLHKRPRHCRCHWKIVRKVRKNCGCRPPTSSRSCVSDNMWEQTVIKYTKPDVPSANCEPRTSISTRMVNCTTPRTKILSCNTHTCYAKEVTIRYKPKLCHCHPVRSYRSLRCCCPAPVVSPERCNATSNQFEQVTSRYTLINNTCVLQQNTTVRTVTCDTRSGETNTSVCNTTSNRQVVTIRDVSIVNCQCVTTTRSLTQPCSCPLNERVEKGLCNGTQNYTTDKYYRQQYNSTTRQCLEVLFNSVQRPCLCNAVSVRITCIGNTLRRVTHSEELVNNTCVKRAYITDREITCAGNGTSTQTRDGCNSVTRTRTITRINYVVENCTCVARSTRSSEICNCFELHGGRHDESTCRADNVTIRHISYYYDGPGGVCLQRNFTTEQRIKCKGKKEVPQGCNRDSRKEEIRIYHLVPIACKCEWSEQPPRYEDCKCKKSYSKKICHHDKQIIVTTYYKLVNGKCQKRKYKRVVPIDCDKKGRKTGIHYGRCSEFSGTRRVVKYVTRVHGCHCVTKRIRQRCPCRCPNSRTWSACKDNKVVTFRLTYQLRGCRCVKNLKNYESRTVCKKRRVARTACIKGLDGDGHLTVVHSREQSVNCRCQLEKHEHQEACLCQARESKNRECQGKKLSIVTTRRLLIQGTCQRVVVKLETQAVTCPLQSVRPVSACNKHGYRLLERTTWKAEDCHCKPHVRLEKQRCNRKCDKGPKVVRESKCDKETCTKRLYYYYKNQKCHSRHFAITAKCCCPPSHHGKQKCVGKAFEVRNLFYKLQHGVCVMSAVKYRQEIDCRRQEIFETATSASGDTIILKTWHAVKDCKCQKYKKKLLSKHRECRQPEVKHECVSVPEQRLVQTVTRFTKHSKHGECQKCEEVIEKPINCPLNIVHRGPCRKDSSRKAFVRVVRRISFRKVDCRCEPKKSTHHEVCRCFQPRFSTRCQGSKGRILITKHHFEVSPSGSKCYGRKETDSIQVNCDSTWRASHRGHFRDIKFHHRLEWHENGEQTEDNMLSRRRRDISETQIEGQDEGSDSGWDGSFSKFLEREVRVGCSCRVQRRKRHCHSRCPKSKKYLKCENGQTLCRVETTYQRNGRCRCSYRVRKNPVKVHLPKPKVVHHGCQKCQERIETIYYRNVNCKAKRFWRWHSRRCCCNKKPVVRVHCKAGQMLVSQRRTERLDKDGHCVPQYENKYKLISCKRIIREKPLTACADGHRVWRRELEKTVNCACKRGSEKIRRRCGFKACHPTVIKHGRCVNCASKVTKTEFIFNSATQKCEAKRFHHKKKCCCPSPRSTKKCIGNRLLLVTISYKYQISSGKCEKCKKSTDITHSIYKRCQRSKKTKIGSCMENGFRVIVTINPTLVDCECHKKQSLKFERCQCELPSVSESCVRNGTLKYRRVIKQELDGTVCKKIKEETYSEVECPVSTTSEGVCDSVSCQRIITDVSYSVENCTCQRLTTQRVETCCCPPTINETRTCERAENVLTITRQYQEFDLRNRACVIRTKTDRVGTICPQNYRSFASPCDQFRNNSFYRTVSESTTVASGCECVPQTTTRTELCGCDSARDYTVCTPENQILTYRIEYKPNDNNTICEPNRVVLNVRDVQCDRTRRSNTPNCTTGTRSETTGETRITVVTTWQRAGRNCTCATQTRSEEILCACPENSEPKTVCDHKRHEKLNVTKVYRLLVTGSIRQCIPSKVVTRLGRIKCQAPVVQLGHCQFGLMTVKTIVHLIHGCHCVPKHFKHQQRCQKHLEPCINKLPDWLCADLDRKHDICTRNFTGAESDPELKQLAEASALCNRQCNRCDGCHSIGGHWQFKYADKECLVTDSRYPGLTIKGTAGFKNCLHKCKKNLSCRSFDFYLPSSQCTLARVDRDSLHDYLLPRKHLLGALPSDNRHRAATRCNLYERICSLRVTTRLQEVQLGCPKRQVSAGKSQCKCEPVSLALGHYRYCYRTATVKYFERSRSGVCVKRRAFLHVPCQHCRDHLSKHKCQAIDAQGGCSVSSTAQLCAKTCRLCLCDGREFVREGHCNQLTGTRVDTVLRTEWVPGFHMCRVVILHAKKRCPKCPVGIVIQPQPCIHGRRKIIHKKTTLIDGKCKESVKREVLKCHGCYAGVATSLGPCIHGHRTLTSVFAIQKKHGHCQERKTSYQVSCVGCPPSVVRTQPCINGRRLRQVSYYVHLPNTAECYKARFETEDRCGTLCHDQISHSECLYQQRTDQCSWNLYTRIVCPSTCNRC